ncbi:MAG: Sua5/YciO/YrdC/YwlC family protein [Shewanellaceae bacterium]|nr:Sua5/YciO/YrdC/YwlC family protein [Shewanellaceae bacterium]
MHLINLEQAVFALQQQQVIAYPTEAVFGLGCDPWSTSALASLLQLKQRPSHKGVIVVVSTLRQLDVFVDWSAIAPATQAQMQAVWALPTPTTWVVPALPTLQPLLCGEHTTIAVRVSHHPVVRALCDAFGGGIVSTSANIAGQVAATTHAEIEHQFSDQVLCLKGGLGGANQASSIFNAITGQQIR